MKISIIIPVFNSENSIGKLLAKLSSLVTNEFEIIIVNDGSKDDTNLICQEFADRYRNFVYFSQENQGVSAARNKGIELATGTYIMFVDSDDDFCENYFYDFFKYARGYDFVFTGYTVVNGKKMVQKNNCFKTESTIRDFANMIDLALNPPYLLSPWAKLFKTSVIRENNLAFRTDMNYGEDVEFVFSYLLYAKTVASFSGAGYIYNIDDKASLSRKFNPNMFEYDMVGTSRLRDLLTLCNIRSKEEICEKKIKENFVLYTSRLVKSKISFSQYKEIFYYQVDSFSLRKYNWKNKKSYILIGLVIKWKILFPLVLLFRVF